MESSTQKHEAQARLSAQPPNAHATSPRPSHDTTRNIPPTDRSDDKTGVYDHSSELESQSTAEPVDAKHDTREITDEIEDAVVGDTEERLSEKLCRVRCTTWWLAGALLIAVPLIVFATIFTKVNISGIRIIGLAIWFEIVWTAGWIIHFSLHILDKGWTKFCATGLQTWAELINRTSSSQLGLVLSAIAWGSSCIICRYGDGNCEAKWLTTFRKVLLATIPAAAIFLLKDILLQIVINLQVSRMFNARKVLLYRQREALGLFSEIVINEQKRRPPPHWLHRLRDHWNNRDKGFFIRKRSPITDPFWLKWRRYTDVSGRDDEFDTDEQTFVNLMRDEFRGSIDISLRVENGNIEGGLNEKFLEQKLEELYSNKANKFAKDRPLQAKEIMRILDKDGNDEITPEEWVEALVETTMAYRDISKSAGGIRCAAKSVDAVISCLLLCIVAILYGTSSLTS